MSSEEIVRLTLLVIISFLAPSLWAANDMRGSQDHPAIPRIEGTVIFGYSYSDYDEGLFALQENGNWAVVRPAGKRTRILYMAPQSLTVPGVLANYNSALDDTGRKAEIFSCRHEKCSWTMATSVVWETNNRIPTTLRGDQYLYENVTNIKPIRPRDYKDQAYWYGTVTTSSSRFHVSIYTALLTEGGLGSYRTEPDVKGLRSIHLEVLEEAEFKPTLDVVTSSEISESIAKKGHIALYGIYFDLDSAKLRPDSAPSLEAIAAAMQNDRALKLYVVGHTDNQGTYEYNLDLSRQRADTVVATLTGEYGITPERLLAAGVGPVAPVASNRNEQGQALNRRVELVEF